MSGAMNRSAVFTSSAQDVEVYRVGGWWPGSLLGWRHEADGSCRVSVRAVVAGVEDTRWIDLADVRLPELPPLRSVDASSPPSATGDRRVDVAGPDTTATLNLLAVPHDEGGRPAGAQRSARARGRRRAPATTAALSGAPTSGDAGVVQVGRAAALASAPGRHRAPASVTAGAGRHRAEDTGVWPAVTGEGPDVPGPGGLPARAVEDGPAAQSRRPVVLAEADLLDSDGDFYTRPLRLASSVRQPRPARRNGSVDGG